MRGRGEPHARGPSSAVLALGCERVGCAPSAAVRRASQSTTQGQRAECAPPRASIREACGARCGGGEAAWGRGLASAGCVRDCGQCCTRQVKLQRRVAEPVRCAWFKRAWHALCSIQHHCATGRRNGNAKTEAVVCGACGGGGANPLRAGAAHRVCVQQPESRRWSRGASEGSSSRREGRPAARVASPARSGTRVGRGARRRLLGRGEDVRWLTDAWGRWVGWRAPKTGGPRATSSPGANETSGWIWHPYESGGCWGGARPTKASGRPAPARARSSTDSW